MTEEDELTYSLTESMLEKVREYIKSQAYEEVERAFSLRDSKLTNEEQAVLIEYKSGQIASNVINAIVVGDIFR